MRSAKATGPEGATVGSWRGYTRYECTACAYDTLSAEAFAEHYRNTHGSLEAHIDDKPAHVEAASVAAETLAED